VSFGVRSRREPATLRIALSSSFAATLPPPPPPSPPHGHGHGVLPPRALRRAGHQGTAAGRQQQRDGGDGGGRVPGGAQTGVRGGGRVPGGAQTGVRGGGRGPAAVGRIRGPGEGEGWRGPGVGGREDDGANLASVAAKTMARSRTWRGRGMARTWCRWPRRRWR